MPELTPMMRQYYEIKNKYKDYILFYRLGDFYEMFFEDALLASRELELALTGRECGLPERAPMCGVPHHASEAYIARLVRKGYKVAICEQLEEAKAGKGLVKRDITRMITPGTVIETSMLEADQNNFLGCIYANRRDVGICFADITTGEVYVTAVQTTTDLFSELGRFRPKEVILGGDSVADTLLHSFLHERLEAIYATCDEENFAVAMAAERIATQFGEDAMSKNGLTHEGLQNCVVGGRLAHLSRTQQASLGSLNTLHAYRCGQYMELDMNARRNLELCETMRNKEKKGSLLWVIDQTKTAMGSRLLRQWIEKPLMNPEPIQKRQQAVRIYAEDVALRENLGQILRQVHDMERLIGRIVYGTANARDMVSLQMAVSYLPEIKRLIAPLQAPLLQELHSRLDELTDVHDLIAAALVEQPPLSLREGGLFRTGFRTEIDELRELASGGKSKIAGVEQRERESTGIKGLKIGYNRVFGYFLEVSKSYAGQVPAHYVRKQTLANCERYITEELKAMEGTVLGAQERLVTLEFELFGKLRDHIAKEVHRVQHTAQAVAHLDVLCGLGAVASAGNYVCPEVDFSDVIAIADGRHPVVEKMLRDSMFIPNDTQLDCVHHRTAIITGPNMAGKSTYMRQVALICILAQIGSFVPAKQARIGICDRVFTRVGASDDLTTGQSTFMVEMREVAEILQFATAKSLLILDEIGRGTSTYDGMSIARAVVEYAVNPKTLGARTLFATHYHELTALEDLYEGVHNYNIAVKKRGDDITFLRKIVRGGADDSYGIEVAKLAGVPNGVIVRAKQILQELEQGTQPTQMVEPSEEQVSLMGNAVVTELEKIQLDTLTPIEALNTLFALKKLLYRRILWQLYTN